MALGKRRRERQMEAFVAASDLPKSHGHRRLTIMPSATRETTLAKACKLHPLGRLRLEQALDLLDIGLGDH